MGRLQTAWSHGIHWTEMQPICRRIQMTEQLTVLHQQQTNMVCQTGHSYLTGMMIIFKRLTARLFQIPTFHILYGQSQLRQLQVMAVQ